MSVITITGYLAILFLAIRIGSWIYRRFFATSLDVTKCGGKWAVITGSTDGIGKAYAFALAKKGLNIVLVSRSPFKLQNVSAEIEAKYSGIKTKIVEVDFAQEDPSKYVPRLEDSLKEVDVGILVNNVGLSYEYPNEFLNLESSAVDDIINVNINSLNAMTRILLKPMVERKNGAVINVSSLSGIMVSPLLAVYSGAKSYNDYFTQALNKEYASHGITFQCVMPGPVVSNMSKIRKPSLMVPTPETFVRSALARLGVDERTSGYWFHDLMNLAIDTLPRSVMAKVIYGQSQSIKKRALKKMEKQK